MPLYKIDQEKNVIQVKPLPFPRERALQKLFEANLEVFLGVRFVASEFTTGDRQRGRIDTLGLDQDGYPTIIEYKKTNKENVINQGLFYLDWLVDHKGDFSLAAQTACGVGVNIDWSHPRLILLAESFSEYDKYAVNRIGANIELWTYKKYGEDLLHLDPIFVSTPQPTKGTVTLRTKEPEDGESFEVVPEAPSYTLEDHLERKPENILELFESLRVKILGLAEEGEVIEKVNKMYIGYSHGKNFCEVRLQSKSLVIWLDISSGELEDPYTLVRDVSNIGHYGTGASEVRLNEPEDLDRVMSLVEQSFFQTI